MVCKIGTKADIFFPWNTIITLHQYFSHFWLLEIGPNLRFHKSSVSVFPVKDNKKTFYLNVCTLQSKNKQDLVHCSR